MGADRRTDGRTDGRQNRSGPSAPTEENMKGADYDNARFNLISYWWSSSEHDREPLCFLENRVIPAGHPNRTKPAEPFLFLCSCGAAAEYLCVVQVRVSIMSTAPPAGGAAEDSRKNT